MDTPLKEQIAAEIVQALITQAMANGLSVNDYLARLLGVAPKMRSAENESLDAFMADLEALASVSSILCKRTN